MAITLTKEYQLLAETKLGSFGFGTLYLREYGKYDSQDTSKNTTKYTLKLAIYCDGDYCNSGNCYAYISGTCIQDNTNLTFPTNGEITLGTKTSTVTHNDDGTRGVEEGGSFNCYAGTNGSVTAYFELPKIARYATISQSLNSKTETTAKINWTSNSTIDYLWYSIDNGSSWIGIDITDAKSGTYTISGLTEYTNYKVKTRVRRKDNQLISDSTSLTVITYPYPYCTSTPNFTIGNKLTLTFYNPLGRSISIIGVGRDGSTIFTGSTTGTSLTGFNDTESVSKQYKSIPNSKSGKYQVQVTCGNVTKTRDNDNTYSIKGTEKPTFTNFTYNDGDTVTTALTGNNQILIKSLSDINVIVTTANKAVGNNSATIQKYRVKVGNQTTEMAYSNSETVSATLSNITTGTIQVTAIDSRGLETTVTKTTTFKDWTKPVFNTVKVDRENGIGTTGLLNLKVSFWNANFGAVANQITKFSYRYKKTTDSSYSSFIDITDRVDINSNGYYINSNSAFLPTTAKSTTATVFEVGYEYNLQFACVDKSEIVVYSNVITLNSGIPCTTKQKNSDGTYSIGINKLPDENYAFDINGNTKINGGMYITGDCLLEQNQTSEPKFTVSNGVVGTALMVGAGGTNRGLWDNTLSKWIVYSDGTNITLNGTAEKVKTISTKPTTATTYRPVWADTNGGNNVLRSNDDFLYRTLHGTATSTGYSILYLGNNTAEGNDGCKYGRLTLYGNGTGYGNLLYLKSSSNVNIYMPAENGTIQLKPTSLYSNSSGATGTITLSETAANFNYLEIFYSASTGNTNVKSVKISAPNSKVAHLDWCGGTYLYYARKTISGTSITTGNYGRVTLTDGTTSSTNQIYIFKVIGYK